MQRTLDVMGSNQWDGLGTRVLSAAILGVVVVAVVYMGGLVFSAVIILFAIIMVYEWNQICENGRFGPVGLLHTVFICAALVFASAGMVLEAAGVALAGLAAAAALAVYLGRPIVWPVLGILYVAIPCISVVWLRVYGNQGLTIVFWSFAVVWATDIGAYGFGKIIGGPRLAPRISPKKTWAGLAGGTLCGTVAGGAVAVLTGLATVEIMMALSFILTFAAHLGDLAESALKRRFDVKDSSNLIPGHGGLLDRVDGLVLVWPVMVALQTLHGGVLLPWVSR